MNDRLKIAVHGQLSLDSTVAAQFKTDLGPPVDDAMSMFITRSIGLGFASFPTRSDGRDPADVGQNDGPEQWTQHTVVGDWSGAQGVRELLALRVGLDAAEDRTRRLPIGPLLAVTADILARIGRSEISGVHAELPVAIAADSLRELAQTGAWFYAGARRCQSDFYVTVRLPTGADNTAAGGALMGELDRYKAVRQYALPFVELAESADAFQAESSCFNGLPATSVTEWDAQLDTWPIAFRCRAPEWSPDLAAWTIELFSEAARRALTVPAVVVRLSLVDSGN